MFRSHALLLATLVACSAASATAAPVSVPSPGNSTIPSFIMLVGQNGAGVADPAGDFTVTVRDIANNPVPGTLVTLDFANAPGLFVCIDPGQPGVSVSCATGHPVVTKVTDAEGKVTMTLIGGSDPLRSAPALQSVAIFDAIQLLGNVRLAALDLDGSGGVGANDLAFWLGDFASSAQPSRADYDGSGVVGANDLSIWLGRFGTGASAAGCAGSRCP